MPNGLKILLAAFAKSEAGATSIEYALIGVGIALAIASAVPIIGSKLSPIFTAAGNAL